MNQRLRILALSLILCNAVLGLPMDSSFERTSDVIFSNVKLDRALHLNSSKTENSIEKEQTTTAAPTTTTEESEKKEKVRVRVTAEDLITKKDFTSSRRGKSLKIALPAPITVTSGPLPVKGVGRESIRNSRKIIVSRTQPKEEISARASRKLSTSNSGTDSRVTRKFILPGDDVTELEGVREPDTVADKHIHWRNAKVINDKLVIVDDKGTIVSSESDSNNVKVMRNGRVIEVDLLKDLSPAPEDSASNRGARVLTSNIQSTVPKEVVVHSGPIGVANIEIKDGIIRKKSFGTRIKDVPSSETDVPKRSGIETSHRFIVSSNPTSKKPSKPQPTRKSPTSSKPSTTLLPVTVKVSVGKEPATRQDHIQPQVQTGFRPITNQFPDFYYKSYYEPDSTEYKDTEVAQPLGGHRDARKQQYVGESADGKPVYYVYSEEDGEGHEQILHQEAVQQEEHKLERLHLQHHPDQPLIQSVLPQHRPTSSQHFGPPGLIPAKPDSFIVKDHSFQMGPGGPIIDVPVPIPKPQTIDLFSHYKESEDKSQPFGFPPHQQSFAYPPEHPEYEESKSGNIFEAIGGHIRKGIDRVHEMVSPVMEPLHEAGKKINHNIQEAGEKISNNLGISEKIDEVNEKIQNFAGGSGGDSVVPVVVAGSAAALLGFGLLFALSASNNSFITIGKRSIDSPADSLVSILKNLDRKLEAEEESRRLKRSLQPDNALNSVANILDAPQRTFLSRLQDYGFEKWRQTPCAKRIFCDVMVEASSGTVDYMEKNMKFFLGLLETGPLPTLRPMVKEVMEAIRTGNCSVFSCGSHDVDSSIVTSSSHSGIPSPR